MSTDLAEEDSQQTDSTSANPFSFKSFLNKRASGGEDGAAGRKGTRKLSKMSQGGGKKGKKEAVLEETLPFPELEETGGAKGKDNPFSFRKFVARKEKQKDKGSHVRPHSSEEDSSSESLEKDDLVTLSHPLTRKSAPEPLVTASTSKPSQKLSTGDRNSVRTRVDRTSKIKPDARPKKPAQFVDSESLSSSSEESSNPTLPLPEGGPFPAPPAIISDPLGVDSVHVDSLGLVHQDGLLGERRRSDSESSSSLEGADEGLGGTEVGFHALPEIPGIDVGSAHLKKEIEKLKDENEKLRSKLKKSEEDVKKEKAKNRSLKEQLKALRVKEAEDMKALEDMVQKVEENLVATTKRATSSEATIVKLKQEIQSLQAQLAKSNPQSVHQHYEEILQGVREKTGFASQQLMATAQKADQSIRELIAGADALKNVAQILEYIDRISEIKER